MVMTHQKRGTMLTPKQIQIFAVFMNKPFKTHTYAEIKLFSHQKSNSLIQKAITAFVTNNLIHKAKIGNIACYKLNLKNNTVFSYFHILIQEQLSALAKKSIQLIEEELQSTPFISAVIFGY